MFSKPTSHPNRTTRNRALMTLALVILIALPASAGTIVGTVKLAGTPPEASTIAIEQDTAACGTSKETGSLSLGADQALQWAVVQVADLGGATTSAEPAKLDQTGCEFVPRVVIARPGEEIAILNSDGILHNVHTYSEENAVMNMAQPGFVQTIPVTFEHAEAIKVTCDVHGWMTGWIVVSDKKHVAVTDESGAFTLENVPAGTHQLTVWHETLGEQTQEVTVQDGQETTVSFELAAQ